MVKYGKECHTFQPQYKTLFGEKKLRHVYLGNGGLWQRNVSKKRVISNMNVNLESIFQRHVSNKTDNETDIASLLYVKYI